MKKITLVIFAAFLAINCSKDDSTSKEDYTTFGKNSTQSSFIEKRNEMNYVILNQASKVIGDLQIYDDDTFLYFNCKSISNYKITEIGLYVGNFETLPVIQSKPIKSDFNYFEEINNFKTEYIYKISKKDIQTDENNCAFISTYFKIINLNSKETEYAWSVSNHLPSLVNSKFYVYCIQ